MITVLKWAHYHKLLSLNDMLDKPCYFWHLSRQLKKDLVSLIILSSSFLTSLCLILNYLHHSLHPPFHSAWLPVSHSVSVLDFLSTFITPSSTSSLSCPLSRGEPCLSFTPLSPFLWLLVIRRGQECYTKVKRR